MGEVIWQGSYSIISKELLGYGIRPNNFVVVVEAITRCLSTIGNNISNQEILFIPRIPRR